MPNKKRPKRPKYPAVSIRAETYELLKAEAAKRGCAVTELVADILAGKAPLPTKEKIHA